MIYYGFIDCGGTDEYFILSQGWRIRSGCCWSGADEFWPDVDQNLVDREWYCCCVVEDDGAVINGSVAQYFDGGDKFIDKDGGDRSDEFAAGDYILKIDWRRRK